MGDMLVKLASIGVPQEMLWEMSGYFSPQQIERMKELAAATPEPPLLAPTPAPLPAPEAAVDQLPETEAP